MGIGKRNGEMICEKLKKEKNKERIEPLLLGFKQGLLKRSEECNSEGYKKMRTRHKRKEITINNTSEGMQNMNE